MTKLDYFKMSLIYYDDVYHLIHLILNKMYYEDNKDINNIIIEYIIGSKSFIINFLFLLLIQFHTNHSETQYGYYKKIMANYLDVKLCYFTYHSYNKLQNKYNIYNLYKDELNEDQQIIICFVINYYYPNIKLPLKYKGNMYNIRKSLILRYEISNYIPSPFYYFKKLQNK